MSLDIAQMNRIHELEKEIDQATADLKAIKERRTELVTELPEFAVLTEAQAAVKEAAVRLKLAIQDDRELGRLAVERGEVAYLLHDLKEQHSHSLIAYTQDTGRATYSKIRPGGTGTSNYRPSCPAQVSGYSTRPSSRSASTSE
ncbi:hypothetical protein [Arthrobacter sp. 9MFCol3.1]|uniref:hypothetical protein n=1 Tax=Arthrobacter sp. 9MFCol3.1 TaxID=1150398 RepID=UPI00047B8449|nr:hypothetical protein [Arthrobacter sp. 9MFCol3.1]